MIFVCSRFSYFGLLLLCALSFSACTKDSGDDNLIAFGSEAEARASFEATKVSCGEDDLNCPESAAGLSLLIHTPEADTKWFSSACSATLIGNNKILTNDHCVPDDVLADDKLSCEKRVKVLFPKTANHPEESFYCQKIYKVAQQRSLRAQRPDWVIIEFSGKTNRKSSNINIEETPSELKLTSYPVYYSKVEKHFDGEMKKNECSTTMKHWFSTYYFHPYSPVVTLAHCSHEVIKGNSGVGFFNSNNELKVIGSFAADTAEGSNTQTLTLFGRHFLINNKAMGGTNLACIKEFNPNPSPFCYYGGGSNFYQVMDGVRFVYDLTDPRQAHILETINSYKDQNSLVSWKESDTSSPFYHMVYSQLHELYNKPAETRFLSVSTIPEIIMEEVSQRLTSTSFPLTPDCIKDHGPNTFNADLPFFQNSGPEMEIDSSGILFLHFTHDPLNFRFYREGNQYKAEVQRLSEKLRAELYAMQTQMESYLLQCHSVDPDDEILKELGDPCVSYQEAKEKIEEWMKDEDISPQLRRNELFMRRLQDNPIEIEIPICS